MDLAFRRPKDIGDVFACHRPLRKVLLATNPYCVTPLKFAICRISKDPFDLASWVNQFYGYHWDEWICWWSVVAGFDAWKNWGR